MTKLGKCMRCRERTALTPVKIETFPGDVDAQYAELCDPCIDKTQRARLTKLTRTPESVVQVYA